MALKGHQDLHGLGSAGPHDDDAHLEANKPRSFLYPLSSVSVHLDKAPRFTPTPAKFSAAIFDARLLKFRINLGLGYGSAFEVSLNLKILGWNIFRSGWENLWKYPLVAGQTGHRKYALLGQASLRVLDYNTSPMIRQRIYDSANCPSKDVSSWKSLCNWLVPMLHYDIVCIRFS